VLLALAGYGPAPAALAGDTALPVLTERVTLTGTTTGYVRVRLSSDLHVGKINAWDAPIGFTGPRAVGYALLPDDPESLAKTWVSLRFRSHGGGDVMSMAWGRDLATGRNDGWYLRAGIYRLFLLTRGGSEPITIRFPSLPAGSRTLAVTHRVPWVVGEFSAPRDAYGRAPMAWEATLDYEGAQPGVVFGVQWLHTTVSATWQSDSCTYDRGDRDRDLPQCQRGESHLAGGRWGPALGDKTDESWTGIKYSGPPGPEGFRVTYLDVGEVTGAGALLFYLPATA
jgi:hypothetical protein